MATTLDLIKGSLRLIGAIATGETPPADEANDVLTALNAMIDAWNIQPLSLYETLTLTSATIASTQILTFGSGGTGGSTRPVRIERVNVTYNGLEIPLRPLTSNEWAEIGIKSTTATIPSVFWYDPEYPLGKLYLWPIPTTVSTLSILAWAQVSALTLAGTFAMPPGYEEAIKYNLAVRLAPEYGVEAKDTVKEIAKSSFSRVKTANSEPITLAADMMLLSASGASANLADFMSGNF